MHSQHLIMDETMARLDDLIRGLMHGGLGNHPQIVGDHAPADLAFHAVRAMIAAAIRLVAPFQPTDPALDARAPDVTTPEPSLLLMCHPCGRLGPRLGQYHLRDAARDGIPLVRGGVETTSLGQQPGRVLEHAQMMVQTRRQLRVFGWIALADDGAMRFKQADCFLGSRYRFTWEDAPGRLGHHVLHQRDNRCSTVASCRPPVVPWSMRMLPTRAACWTILVVIVSRHW
jgi:hypothetical protein